MRLELPRLRRRLWRFNDTHGKAAGSSCLGSDSVLFYNFVRRHQTLRVSPAMAAARKRVMTALKSRNIGFLETVRMDDMEQLFKEGTNVTHGTNEALTNKGRKLTNRQMPY